MQVAEVLSDLTSLRACGHKEALELVSVHKSSPLLPSQQRRTAAAADDGSNPKSDKQVELSRAKELVDLHYGVKVKHMNRGEPAVDENLRRAREEVNRVLREVEAFD